MTTLEQQQKQRETVRVALRARDSAFRRYMDAKHDADDFEILWNIADLGYRAAVDACSVPQDATSHEG